MDERAVDLAAFIDARSGSLLRYPYLLTGDHELAQDLLQNSLIQESNATPGVMDW